ncbi:MAG: TPR repeat domain protein [Oceanicaulis sp. HLUCCA04]|nr:MAG: TPR repeat domain protein [Oceanicaulis sp. HLUCCA04]
MRSFRGIVWGTALLAAIAAPAMAQEAGASFEQQQYEACLSLINDNAEAAYEEGLAWRAQGGGWPAMHCIALSQVALEQYGIAARRLETTAEGAIVATDATRAIILGQAGDAWLAAEEAANAERAFRRGRDFGPDDAGLALGVAEAAALQENWELAEEAASDAMRLDAGLARSWRVRAEARLQRGDLDGAASDIEQALARDDENIETLVLRGRINDARRLQEG